MITKPENWEKLRDREYRHALAVAQFKRFVPFQISALRKQRNWSQQELAESAGLSQGVVSRAEDPDYGNLAANTILRIANGLDCVFVGKFVSYAEFENWRKGLSEDMVAPDFEKEDAKFEEAANLPELPKATFWSQYLEILMKETNTRRGKVTYIDTGAFVPVPQNQALQLSLRLQNQAGFDHGLRIVSKPLANKMQNAPADNAKLPVAVGSWR